MPAAARKLDLCSCPEHGVGVITGPGFAEVLICHQPVVRKGDEVTCITGDVATIVEGCDSVIIGGKPVARKGSKTSHGGVILMGCPRVRICEPVCVVCQKLAARRRAKLLRYRPRALMPKV